jgi:drug/metabolite transporter superfamily protein YnfA
MMTSKALSLLVIGSLLEVLADALIRRGVRQGLWLWIVVGGLMLTVYGLCINLSDMNFGRMMGLYVVVFFFSSQIVAQVAFGEDLNPRRLLAALCIACGGLLLMSSNAG